MNEGVLTRIAFGGERAHTGDHPPVLLSGPKKADAGAFPVGLLLAVDAAGELFAYTGTGTLAGVCDEPSDADAADCVYLVHGIVKARLLSRAGGTAAETADIGELRQLGIFAL